MRKTPKINMYTYTYMCTHIYVNMDTIHICVHRGKRGSNLSKVILLVADNQI